MEEMELDLTPDALIEIPKEVQETIEANKVERDFNTSELESCLSNKIIVVQWLPKNLGKISNKKHALYKGIAEGVTKGFTLPLLRSGIYVNPLTDKEKEFLEYKLGFERNALSIYKKKDNFWDTFVVRLGKEDTRLDLSIPDDYLKYKVLLANSNLICPNLETLENTPKVTYKYVMISEGEVENRDRSNMSITMSAYMEYGKYENDVDTLRTVLEIIQQKSIASNTQSNWIHSQINSIIQSNPKVFLSVIKDEYLDNKVLIKKAVEKGLISNRGGFYYDKKTGQPLCGSGEEPTLKVASKFLALASNQELKFNLQASIK